MTESPVASGPSSSASNYFTLFQLEADPELEGIDLSARKRALLARCHPDRFADASPAERRVAEGLAAEINTAYHTLSHPVRRAGYLLTLAGIELQQAERRPVAPAFLMQQMELREAASQWATLEAAGREQLLGDTKQLFEAQRADFVLGWRDNRLDDASDAWVRMQYLDKLQRELDERD